METNKTMNGKSKTPYNNFFSRLKFVKKKTFLNFWNK